MTEENKTTDASVPGSPDYPLHSELAIGAYLKQQVAIDPDHEFVVYPDRDLRRSCTPRPRSAWSWSR